MTKFNRKANVIHWTDIKDRISELEVANMDHTITLLSDERQNNFAEMDELRRIDDILEYHADGNIQLIRSETLPEVDMWRLRDQLKDYKMDMVTLKVVTFMVTRIFNDLQELFGFSFKNLDQYLADNDYAEIQVFGETYYY